MEVLKTEDSNPGAVKDLWYKSMTIKIFVKYSRLHKMISRTRYQPFQLPLLLLSWICSFCIVKLGCN